MAYANALMFYGWSGKEATDVITKLTKEKTIILKRTDDKTDAFVKTINTKLKALKTPIQFKVFDGGLGEKTGTNCVPYVYFQCKSVSSASDDDFDEEGFSIKEVKEMFNQSFQFSQTFPGVSQPTMRIIVNSDTK